MVVGGRELIDTLWNVNDKVRAILGLDKMELIDTLWNVNLRIPLNISETLRINRYIMECKYKCNNRPTPMSGN